MKKLFFVVLLLPLLIACNNSDDLNGRYWLDIATVENPNASSSFYFRLDNDTVMWTAATNFPYFRPATGKRIIANYTILSEKADTFPYHFDVKLNDWYEVLTKGIFIITPEKQDSIGNDEIHIKNMWIGSHYLNVEFVYPGYNKIHFINLVYDSLKTYTDGKTHLEFRHNANNDYPSRNLWGVASFDLRSLQASAAADSVQLVVHTKEFNSTTEQTYPFTYKFNVEATPYSGTKKMYCLLKKLMSTKRLKKIHKKTVSKVFETVFLCLKAAIFYFSIEINSTSKINIEKGLIAPRSAFP
jgi:hypothetical protein